MSDNPKESTHFVLGQILEKVSNTDANVARLVWRADNIEARVEKLENQASRNSPTMKIVERGIWAVICIGIAVLFI